jgi:hypothetical protein
MSCVPVPPFKAHEILTGVPADQIRIVSQHYVHDNDGRKHGPHGEPRKENGVAVYDCTCDVQGLRSKFLSLKSGNGHVADPKRQPQRCPLCLTNHAGEC